MILNNYRKTISSFFVAGLLLMLGVFSLLTVSSENDVSADDPNVDGFTSNNHVTSAIWEYSFDLNKPQKALVLTFNQNQWEALVAVTSVPAFARRASSTPLMFSDGTGDVSSVIAHDTKAVTTYGSDVASASNALVKNYWSKAELVFAISTYEQALWVVPSASFLGAPILVSPSQDTLNKLGTTCVVAIGDTTAQADQVIILSTKEDVWTFQLELFETKGETCNYVVLTNPLDTDDSKPANIKWRYQSPAAALLAAYRHGIVQTGDWSINRTSFEAVETATDPDVTNYEKIKPGFTKLKEDSYTIEKFLQDNGHTPEYLAAVGGPYSVPNYVYDIHVDYYWPTKNPQKTQYPSSLAAYATLTQTVDDKQYTKEDLGAGRLAAGSCFDLTKQVMRSFFYREFLPSGSYYSAMPSGWETRACQVDGHRLNQPEPDSHDWDVNDPYYPHKIVKTTFEDAGLTTKYYLPRNESDGYDTNLTIQGTMEATADTGYGYMHFTPHGGKTWLRIEVGIKPDGTGESMNLEAATIHDLNYKAPTLIYTTCCKGGYWMPDKKAEGLYEPSEFIPSSFIHAGAVAYIATPEIQTTCFWKEAPYGVSTQQATNFWEKIFSGNMPIGKALKDSKWEARNHWQAKPDAPQDKTHEVDCISYTLFGDPALEIYKPNQAYSAIKDMDLEISFGEIKTGENFTVQVSTKDVISGAILSNATVTITFEGTEKTGTNAIFTAPTEAGEYSVSVEVTNTGYSELKAQSWLQIGEVTPSDGADGNGDGDDKKDDDKDKGFLPGFEAFTIICAFTVSIIILGSARKRNE